MMMMMMQQAWYDQENPPVDVPLEKLICGKCEKRLYHVAQVYAPVETHRTLYVFGCNSADCTSHPGR